MRLLSIALASSLFGGCASLSAPPAAPPAAAADNFRAAEFARPAPGAYVALLPPEAERAELRAGLPAMEAQLQAQLAAAGLRVAAVDPQAYSALWERESAAAGGIYDAASGSLKVNEYVRALNAVVQQIGRDTGAAIVLRPRLVLRAATRSRESVEWDGQRRPPPTPAPDAEPARPDSNVLGMSVELMALSPSGTVLLRSFGGSSLPFRVDPLTRRTELRSDLFAQQEELAQGVAIALASLLRP